MNPAGVGSAITVKQHSAKLLQTIMAVLNIGAVVHAVVDCSLIGAVVNCSLMGAVVIVCTLSKSDLRLCIGVGAYRVGGYPPTLDLLPGLISRGIIIGIVIITIEVYNHRYKYPIFPFTFQQSPAHAATKFVL